MLSGGTFLEAYNAQAADVEHLLRLVNETLATTGRTPGRLMADAGYHSQENIEHVKGSRSSRSFRWTRSGTAHGGAHLEDHPRPSALVRAHT